MENHKDLDSSFGLTVFKAITEFNQNLAKALLENGKTDDEVKEYFESDEYRKNILDTYGSIIISVSESLEKHFNEDTKYYKKDRDLYLKHLQSIWGQGISWMEQYWLKCMDICDGYVWYMKKINNALDKPNTFIAIHAIHGKAMLVYAEIICLLQNGFPDGAHAHYRTLYELWAVAEFLDNDTDDIAKAYIESANSKLENEADHYKWSANSLRFVNREKPITINNIVTEAHATFALRFAVNPSKTALKKVYYFPNAIIHPSAKGVFGRTSHPQDNCIPIGQADTGLSTPAINSSMTLFNITHIFLSLVANPASSIGIGILDNIIGQRIVPFFEDIENMQNKLHANK